jgi:hypothetical protein
MKLSTLVKRSKSSTVETKKVPPRITFTIGVFILILLGIASGGVQFAVATIRCGKLPVSASKFAASYIFELPGERGYGPNFFNQYFCTRALAEKAYFRHSGLTDLGQKEKQAQSKASADERAYQPSKVPFVVLTPTYLPAGYEKEGQVTIQKYPNGIQVFQTIIRTSDKYAVALLRQGTLGDDYEACAMVDCMIVGKAPQGQTIYKNVTSSRYEVRFEKNFFNLEPDNRFGLSEPEALKIMVSLAPVK